MPADSSRILELRRRVQADPASIAFAQLAEELRRAGAYDEAVGVCRSGLTRHPGYLSARVTLGRTLIELGLLDEASRELDTVIATAPDNLAAIRGLAEIHQRRGAMPEALAYYKRALDLARHDPELEEAVDRITQVIDPAPAVEAAAPTTVEELFDFDKLLEQLGVLGDPPVAPAAAALAEPVETAEPVDAIAAEPAPATADAPGAERPGVARPDDPFAALEGALREHEREPVLAAAGPEPSGPSQSEARALRELDGWLAAIVANRV